MNRGNQTTASSPRPSPPAPSESGQVSEREKSTAVHGHKAGFSNVGAFHEPTNGHAAPTELGEGARGVGNYRHGAPTELFKLVHGHSACAKQKEALQEPRSRRRKEAGIVGVHGPNPWPRDQSGSP
jgi:hypothetical protein